MNLSCVECGASFAPELLYQCPVCGGILETVGQDGVAPFSFGEGETPLLRASRIEAGLPGFSGEIWLKDETRKPAARSASATFSA